ncbi:MAG: hypothetical protein SPK00_06455 [Corynebacterium glucuronolyticum]|nr:hypothetical protein [Mycobacteriaceae bacterium]MDY5834373.1 hypothetical protein [Corynebacterium glucuronolyticum]
MKLLTRVSIASVIVSVPAIAWTFLVLTALVTNSVIPFGGGLASLSFVFILLVAVPVELAAIVIAANALRRGHRSLLTAGHALCLAGFLIQTVLLCFPMTGWELLFLPLALGPGQLLVLAGLICTRRARA